MKSSGSSVSKTVDTQIPLEIHQNFRHRFEQRRQELRLSQREMAKKVGVSVNTIQSYEKGYLPRGRNLLVVAEVLECSIDWLVGLGINGQYQSTSVTDEPMGMYFGVGEFMRVERLKLHEDEVEVKDSLLFRREWLEEVSSNAENVRMVFPNPSGLTDQIMLIDQGKTGLYQGCQYLIEINGLYSFNRVSIRPGNMLHLSTIDERTTLDFEVQSSEVRIIGRLILAIHRM